MSILNNSADAEEVAQEAILKAFTALPRFLENASSAPG
jgi:DNA-directed RNA polymerase specialized sigma24 family protein